MPPVRPSLDRSAAVERLAAAIPAVADDLVRPLLEMLRQSREAFDGDLEKFLIMLAVAQRATQDPRFAAFTAEQLEAGEVAVFPSLGVNMRSVAESIGAPRESVRRKVGDLVGAGWLKREGRELFITAEAYQALTAVREAVNVLAVRNYEVVRDVLDGDDHPLTVPA